MYHPIIACEIETNDRQTMKWTSPQRFNSVAQGVKKKGIFINKLSHLHHV